MHATDTEGQTMINAISEFCAANGYEAYDPGAYTSGATDYTSVINNLKKENCDAVVGVMLTSDFGTFYSQLKSSGYMPKVTTVAKATLFKEDVDAAGADGLADGLCSEVWWTASHPFKSSITGETCEDIGKAWMELTGASYAPATAGYDYANVEILYNVLKNAGSLDTQKLVDAAANLDVDTVIGKVKYNEQHYSVQPLVTGQWIYNKKDGSWTQEIVANTQVPDCPTTAELKLN
jgi:branched-chain amino acid transport system substrate-binding protein